MSLSLHHPPAWRCSAPLAANTAFVVPSPAATNGDSATCQDPGKKKPAEIKPNMLGISMRFFKWGLQKIIGSALSSKMILFWYHKATRSCWFSAYTSSKCPTLPVYKGILFVQFPSPDPKLRPKQPVKTTTRTDLLFQALGSQDLRQILPGFGSQANQTGWDLDPVHHDFLWMSSFLGVLQIC